MSQPTPSQPTPNSSNPSIHINRYKTLYNLSYEHAGFLANYDLTVETDGKDKPSQSNINTNSEPRIFDLVEQRFIGKIRDCSLKLTSPIRHERGIISFNLHTANSVLQLPSKKLVQLVQSDVYKITDKYIFMYLPEYQIGRKTYDEDEDEDGEQGDDDVEDRYLNINRPISSNKKNEPYISISNVVEIETGTILTVAEQGYDYICLMYNTGYNVNNQDAQETKRTVVIDMKGNVLTSGYILTKDIIASRQKTTLDLAECKLVLSDRGKSKYDADELNKNSDNLTKTSNRLSKGIYSNFYGIDASSLTTILFLNDSNMLIKLDTNRSYSDTNKYEVDLFHQNDTKIENLAALEELDFTFISWLGDLYDMV